MLDNFETGPFVTIGVFAIILAMIIVDLTHLRHQSWAWLNAAGWLILAFGFYRKLRLPKK
jgi:hypothetical protein